MEPPLITTARAGEWQSGVTLAFGDYHCVRCRQPVRFTCVSELRAMMPAMNYVMGAERVLNVPDRSYRGGLQPGPPSEMPVGRVHAVDGEGDRLSAACGAVIQRVWDDQPWRETALSCRNCVTVAGAGW